MKNIYLLKVASGLALIVTSLLVAGCSSSPATTQPPAPSTPAPTPSPSPSPTPTRDVAALKAKGEEIYQKTAGGTGCKLCHGTDGKGGNLGPDIRGKGIDDIKRSLATSDQMRFIQLSSDDIEAVAVYVKSLGSQP